MGNSNKGLYATAGENAFQKTWIELAGGLYASSLLGVKSNEVSAEAILNLNPDIVIIGGSAQHELYAEIMKDTAWKEIKAVKNKKVYTNPYGIFSWDRFSAESALQIQFAASVINPELYSVDLVQEVQNFYKKFTNVELTKEQAKNMIKGYSPTGEPIKPTE